MWPRDGGEEGRGRAPQGPRDQAGRADRRPGRHHAPAEGRAAAPSTTPPPPGRVVLRDEVYEDGVFTGHKAEGRDVDDDLRRSTTRRPPPTGHLRVQRRARLVERVAAPRAVRSAARADGRRRRRCCRRRTRSPTTPSPCSPSATWCFIDPVSTGYSRAVEGTKPEPFHGYQGDIESVGRADPALDVAAQAVDVAEARRRASPTARCAAPRWSSTCSRGYGMYVNGLIADLQRARPVVDRLREPAQRPRARALPADLRRHRALPRRARPRAR